MTTAKAYLIHSTDGNKSTAISELTDDYLMPTGRVEKVFINRSMEAPAVFKRDGKYHFIASGCTGWSPNAARSASRIRSGVHGRNRGIPPWGRGARRPSPPKGPSCCRCDGGKGGFIFMADRWNMKDLGNSGYLWLPIRFDGDKPIIENPLDYSMKYFHGLASVHFS